MSEKSSGLEKVTVGQPLIDKGTTLTVFLKDIQPLYKIPKYKCTSSLGSYLLLYYSTDQKE